MKRNRNIVYQILKNLASNCLRNFGRLTTLIVGMRNEGSDNKWPRNRQEFFLPPLSEDIQGFDSILKIIQPQEIMKILKDNGTIVTIEEAEIILKFMWHIAKMALDTYLKI
jgi:hypothetical protein